MTYLYAFLAMFALDFVWAFYTKAIANHNVMMAGFTAGLILLLNSIVVLSYVSDKWAIIPAAFGAVTGTMAALKLYEKRNG